MGMDRPVSLMRSELLIALMLDCRGRRESERGGEKKRKEKRREEGVEAEMGSEKERVLKECVPGEPVLGWGRASGMLPWRAQ